MSTEIPQTPQKTRIETPDATETGRIVDPNGPDRKGFTRRQKLIGTVLALGTLAGGAGAANYFSSHVEAPAPADQDDKGTGETQTPLATQSAEASPSASPSNITPLETAKPTLDSKEQLIASLELSVEKYPDVQSLAKGIISDRWTAWKNQGATQENNDKFLKPDTNMSAAEFAEAQARANATIFPKALFVEGYETNANLLAIAKRETDVNSRTLERTLITWDDSTPYKRSMDIVGKAELVGGSIEEKQVAFKVNWIDSSNAEDNRIGTEYDKEDVNPYTGSYTITAVIVNGKWKIANIY